MYCVEMHCSLVWRKADWRSKMTKYTYQEFEIQLMVAKNNCMRPVFMFCRQIHDQRRWFNGISLYYDLCDGHFVRFKTRFPQNTNTIIVHHAIEIYSCR